MSSTHRKYCRCIINVADKQSPKCLKKRAWFKTINGKECYNPYSICTSSTMRKGNVECFKNINLNALPKSKLKALADLKQITVFQLLTK